MSGSALGGVGDIWKRTIQRPLAAATEKTPATSAQRKTWRGTRKARRLRRRASAVLRGNQRPPRYCHITQSTSAITADRPGNRGIHAEVGQKKSSPHALSDSQNHQGQEPRPHDAHQAFAI